MNAETSSRPRRRHGNPVWKRRLFVWLGSLLVLGGTIGVLGWLAWVKYHEIQAAMNTPPPPEMPTVVGLQPVETLAWRNSTNGIGTVLAPRSITVNNETPGTVSEVHFQSGQVVEAGVKLLQLDTSVEQAQLKAAMAREEFARKARDRNQEMADRDAIAISELENVESQWRQAVAEVEELQAMIARKAIFAPFRGRVGISDVQKGQYLQTGSMITTLQSIEDHLLIEFTLSQDVVNQLNLEDTVSVSSEAQSWSAPVAAIDAQADRQTRHVRVRARLDNPPQSLSPGDSVTVTVEYGSTIELPAIPAEAIRRSPQGAFAFVVERNEAGEMRASARSIVPATSSGSRVGIAQGITTGEKVVVEGSFKLHDGALIATSNIESPADPPLQEN